MSVGQFFINLVIPAKESHPCGSRGRNPVLPMRAIGAKSAPFRGSDSRFHENGRNQSLFIGILNKR